MPSKLPCPRCGEFRFHKSHAKTYFNKLKKLIIRKRPYRCHQCGYKTWVKSSILKSKTTIRDLLVYLAVFIIAVIMSLFLKKYLL
jgi:predicted nucleic-acid-binding Zn-ribbon protein